MVFNQIRSRLIKGQLDHKHVNKRLIQPNMNLTKLIKVNKRLFRLEASLTKLIMTNERLIK